MEQMISLLAREDICQQLREQRSDMLLVAAQIQAAGIDGSARMCVNSEQTCLIVKLVVPSISISKTGCLNQEKSQLP